MQDKLFPYTFNYIIVRRGWSFSSSKVNDLVEKLPYLEWAHMNLSWHQKGQTWRSISSSIAFSIRSCGWRDLLHAKLHSQLNPPKLLKKQHKPSDPLQSRRVKEIYFFNGCTCSNPVFKHLSFIDNYDYFLIDDLESTLCYYVIQYFGVKYDFGQWLQ